MDSTEIWYKTASRHWTEQGQHLYDVALEMGVLKEDAQIFLVDNKDKQTDDK